MKKAIPPASSSSPITYTWYLRDASGNIMATETHDGTPHFESNPLALNIEYPLYGSSRIGVKNYDLKIHEDGGDYLLTDNNAIENAFTRTLNLKNYELSNHLGNVLVTVSDKKIGHDDGFGGFTYYTADVTSAQDYYPFGMVQPGRSFSSGSYKFGFNGKEKDDEASGTGNQYDYGFRIYNPRIGKFLSVDPLTKSYPWYTPYQFAGNTPIIAVDLDGLEEFVVIRWYDSEDKYTGSTVFRIEDAKDRLQESGTLIVNMNHNDQATFDKNIDRQFKEKLFNVDEEGSPISLKGGAILDQSPNQLERDKIDKVDPAQTNDPKSAVFIKYGKTDIPFVTPDNTTPVDGEMIDNLKGALSVNPEYGIEVIGHASQEPNDNVTPEHNKQISKERAQNIGNQIINSGIPADKVSTDGVGTSQPKYSNNTEAGRQGNRRASIGLTVPKNKKYD